MYTIAVLITCHNRKDKTLACLNSLFSAQLPKDYSYKVFLVDDGSSDGTADAVSKNYPSVAIIQGNGHLYWAGGMRLAWEKAIEKGPFDYFLWLNDDTFLLPTGICEMLEGVRYLQEKGVVCGAIIDPNFEFQTYGGSKLVCINRGHKLEPNGDWQECDLIHGNCVIVPAQIMEVVGIIDRRFRHAIGDFDYGLRVKKAGFQLITTRSYVATCSANTSSPKWCLAEVPFRERLRSLYSPLGNSEPFPYFIFTYRHFGLLNAVRNFLTIHIRLLFPNLWLK